MFCCCGCYFTCIITWFTLFWNIVRLNKMSGPWTFLGVRRGGGVNSVDWYPSQYHFGYLKPFGSQEWPTSISSQQYTHLGQLSSKSDLFQTLVFQFLIVWAETLHYNRTLYSQQSYVFWIFFFVWFLGIQSSIIVQSLSSNG